MKFRIALFVCAFAFGCGSVVSQTTKDIEASYGRPENVYSVGEHLWMTPAYGVDRQLCRMRVYPKRVSINTNYLDDKLDMDEVLKFIDKLAPVKTRGARKEFFGTSDLGGGVIWTRFNYDHVRFVFISTFRLDKLPERQPDRPDELIDFLIDEKAAAEFRRKEALQSDDDLIRKYTSTPKLLEIYWDNRRCLEL
jgi:hypothetical protein